MCYMHYRSVLTSLEVQVVVVVEEEEEEEEEEGQARSHRLL